jgi:hypothetical protein
MKALLLMHASAKRLPESALARQYSSLQHPEQTRMVSGEGIGKQIQPRASPLGGAVITSSSVCKAPPSGFTMQTPTVDLLRAAGAATVLPSVSPSAASALVVLPMGKSSLAASRARVVVIPPAWKAFARQMFLRAAQLAGCTAPRRHQLVALGDQEVWSAPLEALVYARYHQKVMSGNFLCLSIEVLAALVVPLVRLHLKISAAAIPLEFCAW